MKRIDISRMRKNRSIFMKLGLIGALSVVIMAFNYTSYDSKVLFQNKPVLEKDDEIQITPTIQKEKKKLPPPKPEPTNDFAVEDDVQFTEEPLPDLISDDITDDIDDILDEPPLDLGGDDEPEIQVQEVVDEVDEEPILFADFMPQFGDCDLEGMTKEEKKQCSDEALIEYFAKHIRYPAPAREVGIEGTVVLRFVVDKDGSITDVKVVRDLKGGCSEEALRVLNTMPKWKPGRQHGRNVKVYFTMPVKFVLK